MVQIKVLEKVLDANDKIAADNRRIFVDRRITAVNLMSGPGAGRPPCWSRPCRGWRASTRWP